MDSWHKEMGWMVQQWLVQQNGMGRLVQPRWDSWCNGMDGRVGATRIM